MKKNPIYMYVLLALSAMGTLLTAQSFFGLAKVELTDEMAASLNLTTALEREEYKAFLEKLIVALRGPIAWLLLSLLIGGLIAVAYFFLSKKDIVKATYAYMGQIGAFVLMLSLIHIFAVFCQFFKFAKCFWSFLHEVFVVVKNQCFDNCWCTVYFTAVCYK